ncbi:uncharacterized protein [Ptychodera flava]|uniref:uncharacterized protein n=1 Tax=Ptychodera flava TaxID=63121 RepID=UPI003969CAE3
MLPSTFRCKMSPSVKEDEDDILRKARHAAVIKVKMALKARYPRFVEHLFDISLAYVWWARGHLVQASELLFKAAEQVKTSTTPAHKDSTDKRNYHPHPQKAMYMNDAGLMYAVFGDPSLPQSVIVRPLKSAALVTSQGSKTMWCCSL